VVARLLRIVRLYYWPPALSSAWSGRFYRDRLERATLPRRTRNTRAPWARYALAVAAFFVPAALVWSVCSRTSLSSWRSWSDARDVSTEPTPSVPTDVVFYPHVLYGGDDAYLVEGRWYRPQVNGWAVFTKEPLELAMIRRSLERKRGVARWFDL
jgi:hypothetical protein